MCCFEVTAKQDHRLEECVLVKCRLAGSERVLFHTLLFIAHQNTATLSIRKPASATTYSDAGAQVSNKRFCLCNPHDLCVGAEENVEHGT